MTFINEEIIKASQDVILIVVGLGIVAVLYLTIVALVRSDRSED